MPQPGPDNNFILKFGAVLSGLVVLLFTLLMSSMLGPLDVPHHSQSPALTPALTIAPTALPPTPTPIVVPATAQAPTQPPGGGNLDLVTILLIALAVFIALLTGLSALKLAQSQFQPPMHTLAPAPQREADAHDHQRAAWQRADLEAQDRAWQDFHKRKSEARERYWARMAMQTREAAAQRQPQAAAPEEPPAPPAPAKSGKVSAAIRNSQRVQAEARKAQKRKSPDRNGSRNGKVNKPGPGKRRG